MAIYRKTRLTLPEVAHVLNIAYKTALNWRACGTFPIAMAGHPLTASVDDVGRYLQSLDTPTSAKDARQGQQATSGATCDTGG